MEFKKLERYLINKEGKTDMLSSLKRVNKSLIKEKMKEYDIDSIEELAEFFLDDFKFCFESSKDDVFTQMFFERLLAHENTAIFSPYESDVETFVVFAYDNKDFISYYIPDEIKEILVKEVKPVNYEDITRQLSKDTKRVKVGRNEPCPCGSGKKYKKCCGK